MRFLAVSRYSKSATRILSILILLPSLLVLPQCAWEMPGCGPGEIDRNPIESNLIESTVPASGHIKRDSEFNSLQVVFLVPMIEDTFSVEDDMGICRLGDGERVCTPNPASDVFDEDDFEWLSPDILMLNIKPGAIDPERYNPERYMIRFKKDGTESPITSVGDSVLEDHVDIYLTVVNDNEERTLPYVSMVTPLDIASGGYIAPHDRISIWFSERMGYINVEAEPLWGFNFRAITKEQDQNGEIKKFTVVESDSIQGLTPGLGYDNEDGKYWVAFWSDDVSLEELAPSMDRYGNTLTIRGDTKPHSFLPLKINVSHVRILFPFHASFSDADNWYEQLGISFIDSPYMIVQVSSATKDMPDGSVVPLVSELRSDFFGHQEDVSFETVQIDEPGQVVQISDCSLDSINSRGISSLVVHAYDSEGEWLGYDRLYVSAEPDIWLVENPTVANSMIWHDGDGLRSWSDWPTLKKKQLRRAFYRTREWFRRGMTGPEPVDLEDPPPNELSVGYPRERVEPRQAFSPTNAWKMYRAYAAMSLVVEIDNHVPWSLVDFSSSALEYLLDSRYMFTWRGSNNYYQIKWDARPNLRSPGLVVPSTPTYSYTFLHEHNYIIIDKPTVYESMRSSLNGVINWLRDNADHFACGVFDEHCVDRNWEYIGWPPVRKIIEGTESGWGTIRHWSFGCHGNSGFIASLLRVINIPTKVEYDGGTGHAQAYFPELSLYLVSGDDPTNSYFKYCIPPREGTELLILKSTWQSMFLQGSKAEKIDRMLRFMDLLAINALPNVVLKDHCLDTYDDLPTSHSRVFCRFKDRYTWEYLAYDRSLWIRLDNKVRELGGNQDVAVSCGAIGLLDPIPFGETDLEDCY